MALLLTAGFASDVDGQVREPPLVLITSPSTRFAGLNGAGAALVGDAAAIFTNPAGLATVRNIALEGGYESIPGGGSLFTAAFANRIKQFDIGIGLRVRDESDGIAPILGSPDDSETLGVAGVVYRYGFIALGASGKYVRERVDDEVREGVSGDLGIAFAFFDIAALGFSAQNVVGNLRSDDAVELPRLYRLGFTLNFVDPQDLFRLLGTVEWQWPEDQGTRFVVGGEAGIVFPGGFGLTGRLAYGSTPDDLAFPAVTYGISVQLNAVKVDGALEPSGGREENVYRIGLRLTL